LEEASTSPRSDRSCGSATQGSLRRAFFYGGSMSCDNVECIRTADTLSDLAATPCAVSQVFCQSRTGTDDSYAGVFVWKSGDRTANVLGDPLQGIWVAPATDPTGSAGAWRRVFEGETNPKWFGAGLGGDDTPAFSAAAKLANVSDYLGGGLQSGLVRPLKGCVTVSAGQYTLSSLVDTYGRDIVWSLDPAAVINNPNNINGQNWRGGWARNLAKPIRH